MEFESVGIKSYFCGTDQRATNKIKSLLIYTIESNLIARNWFNYTVSKYYNKHNN